MRYARFVASIGITAALAFVPGSLRAADPYEINVILNLTGGAALGGKQSADTLHIIEDRVNKTGGVAGRPLKFVIADDQSNPQTAVVAANLILAKSAPVILGPATTASCNAIFPLIQQNGPVLWCFSPGFHPPKDSYGFSSNTSTSALIVDTIRYFHALGMNKLALLASTDATGLDGEHMLDAAVGAPELQSVSIVARQHFNVDDISVAAQMAAIKAAGAQALLAWTSLTPFATVVRGFTQAGLDIPIATTNANGSAAQLKSYATFIPKTVLIAAMLNQVPDQIPRGPIKRKVDEFYNAYKTTVGFLPEGSANLPWDATNIIIDAIKQYGPSVTARQIHDYIENLHGWVGINGEFDFRDGSQRGLGEKNLVIMRWDPAKNVFYAVSQPGGVPLK
jgi:branched-chain amino acid transport system substrate-binding protein